ncbi:MAG: chorismate mutase [Lachnospiraceae bacterium]|nr:chorismate mutase [Lachnospiraceae bacterium]
MKELTELRTELDAIDKNITELLLKRLELSAEVGEYKKQSGKKVYDSAREAEKIGCLTAAVSGELEKKYIADIYEHIMNYSREVQYLVITENR